MLSFTSFQSCFRLKIYIKRSSNNINVPLRNTSVFGKNVFLEETLYKKGILYNVFSGTLYNFIYIIGVFRPKAMRRRVNSRQILYFFSPQSKALINTPSLTLLLEEPCYAGTAVRPWDQITENTTWGCYQSQNLETWTLQIYRLWEQITSPGTSILKVSAVSPQELEKDASLLPPARCYEHAASAPSPQLPACAGSAGASAPTGSARCHTTPGLLACHHAPVGKNRNHLQG